MNSSDDKFLFHFLRLMILWTFIIAALALGNAEKIKPLFDRILYDAQSKHDPR